jgi:hypothetical protein
MLEDTLPPPPTPALLKNTTGSVPKNFKILFSNFDDVYF